MVVPKSAILLRPGAPSRLSEREAMRNALGKHFDLVPELQEGEFVDGGDVLVTPKTVFIGLSKRTDRAGAESLRDRNALGREARIVETPQGMLHFKTASSLIDENTILATRAMAESGVFEGYQTFSRRKPTKPQQTRCGSTTRSSSAIAIPKTSAMIRGGLDLSACGHRGRQARCRVCPACRCGGGKWRVKPKTIAVNDKMQRELPLRAGRAAGPRFRSRIQAPADAEGDA